MNHLTLSEREALKLLYGNSDLAGGDIIRALIDEIETLERKLELRKPHISEDEIGELCFEFWGEGTKKITMYIRPTDLFKSSGPLDEMPDIPKTWQEIQKGFEWLYEAALTQEQERG